MNSLQNKPFLFFTMLIFILSSFGKAKAQTIIGAKAGVNFSNVLFNDENGNKAVTESTPGIVLGFTVNVPIAANFSIQPGLQYADKGFKQQTGGFYGMATNFKVDVSYLELPVNLLYKPKLGPGRLILGTGLYAAYGTGGIWKADNAIVIGDIVTDSKGKVIFRKNAEDGEFGTYLYGKPLDYGANFLAGYEFFKSLPFNLTHKWA